MMWYGSGPGGWAAWFAMTAIMVLFWGGIAALIVWLVRSARSSTGPTATAPRSDAASILRERFARGEIDAEEYRERMHVLEGGAPRSSGT